MTCTYVGDFNKSHSETIDDVDNKGKLRRPRMIGNQKRDAVQSIVNEGIAPAMYQISVANQKMVSGSYSLIKLFYNSCNLLI